MMHQYIGARYVPIFYQNSLDPTSTEWESNVTYEPMTWVSLSNGNMYLSKKTVPANIGSPASNPEYWMEAGQFNAYINSLQNQINDMNDGSVPGSLQDQINDMNDGSVPGSLQDQINDMNNQALSGSLQNQVYNLKHRYFLLVGDSLGRGYDPDVPGTEVGWANWCKAWIEAAGGRCYYEASNGAGFAVSNSWKSNIENDATLATIKDEITDVIIIGGSNDMSNNGVTSAGLQSAIDTFFNFAIPYFPNAKFKVGCMTAFPALSYNDSASTFLNYKNKSAEYGAAFLGDLEMLCANPDFMSSDLVHLSLSGYKTIARYVLDAIITGHCHYNFSFVTNLVKDPTYNITTTDFKAQVIYNESETHINIVHSVTNMPGVVRPATSITTGSAYPMLKANRCFPIRNTYRMSAGFSDVIEVDTNGGNWLLGKCGIYFDNITLGDSYITMVFMFDILSFMTVIQNTTHTVLIPTSGFIAVH